MIQGVTEREPALALCRALNDWLAEYCAHDPSRLIGVATLPMTNADDALAEARRCVEQLRLPRRVAPARALRHVAAPPGRRRTNRCGRISKTPTCRSASTPA